MLKKLLVGGIVGGIVLFLLGWLFYGILLMDFMKAHAGPVIGCDRPQPLFEYIILGNLITGVLLAYVLAKANANSASEGLITGGIVGFLVGSSVDCMMYSMTMIMSRTAIIADVITFTIMCAIAGAVIVLVSGSKK